MSTYYIPNTQVEAQVIDPPSGSDHVPLFLGYGDKADGKFLGSVNAGTSNSGSVFKVGLGGINGGFKAALLKAGQKTDEYQQIHQDLYDAAGKAQTSYKSEFTANNPVRFSLMLKPDPSYNLPYYDGIVFIDAFNMTQLPHQNFLNQSMIYLVPPDYSNYADDASFLVAIEASCITIVKALDMYNTSYAYSGNASGLDTIENIRMCLFSGGIYRGAATQDKVALHNLAGLEKGLAGTAGNSTTVSKVTFENSFDPGTNQNVFRVIQGKLST